MTFAGVTQFFRNLGNTFRSVPYRARHVAAWAFVKSSVAFGRSYQQIVSDMTHLGLMSARSPFRADVEGYVNMLQQQATLIGWPDNSVPGFEQVTEFRFSRAEHFRWIVKVLVSEPGGVTGHWQFISLYTNRLMTPRDLMANLGLFIRVGSESIGRQIIDYELWAIQHNPGAPWSSF